MGTIHHSTALTTLECCKCGGALGLNAKWVQNARATGNQKHQFWCPYCGTTQGWGGKSQSEKLKEEVERWKAANDRLAKDKADALAEADHFRRSRDGMKGVVAKIKKRVGRGVCPCCNRHFANLERHMVSQHPEVATGEVYEG